jgi:predicted nucleic acid-binding protein
MIYLDSSALVKLALTGPESAELARWLSERDGQPLVSSVLHRAEVPRAVWQAEPGALPRSYKVIKRIARVALSPDVLDDSATLPPQELSPAHAIHLASALAVKRDLTAFVSYDGPLLAALHAEACQRRSQPAAQGVELPIGERAGGSGGVFP